MVGPYAVILELSYTTTKINNCSVENNSGCTSINDSSVENNKGDAGKQNSSLENNSGGRLENKQGLLYEK